MGKKKDNKTLKHIQEVELMILKDFIKICEKHDLGYYLFFGSQIGAIRHNGFIPWDDDIDVVMFRDDYEMFLKVMEKENSQKYDVFDCRYNPEYFFQFGRISLKNTYWAEFWDEQVSFKLGIHVDIFILDKLPENMIKRKIFINYCYIMNRLYAISTIKLENYPKWIMMISNIIHHIFKFLKLTPEYFQKKVTKLFKKYENTNSEYITDLTLKEKVYYKISDYKPAKKELFEDILVNIPNNDYNVLYPLFGDYMKLPPEEERQAHILNEIDFGEY